MAYFVCYKFAFIPNNFNRFYEFTIFHNLHNCSQLKIFSYAHCKIYWSPNEPKPVPMYLTNIGQFCTRWLLRSAPLSLREYTGPLHSRDQLAVKQRYSTIDNFCSPAINLIPEPLAQLHVISKNGDLHRLVDAKDLLLPS